MFLAGLSQNFFSFFFFFCTPPLATTTTTTTSMFQKKRPDRRAFAIEQGPHTYVGKPLEGQSAYTTHACGKELADRQLSVANDFFSSFFSIDLLYCTIQLLATLGRMSLCVLLSL